METISTANLTFSHDFRDDLAQIRLEGEPYALARMADGERYLMQCRRIVGADGWTSPGHPRLMSALWDVMGATDDGFHIGVSCPCCDQDSAEWYRRLVKLPESRLTYSNLFVNGNFPEFANWLQDSGIKHVTVGWRPECDIQVPRNVVNHSWDTERVVTDMLLVDRPILVAAGPASAALILRYWRKATKRQICLDVGSAADFAFTGQQTRTYHSTPSGICQWQLHKN